MRQKTSVSPQDYYALEVRKANALIQKSRFNLSLQQQKILLFLISQIDPAEKDFRTYTFSIKDFCAVCGMDMTSGRNYRMLKNQIKEIADKSIWMNQADREVLVRLIEKPEIIKESGIVRIRFDKDMMPYLLQLRSNYTKYELIYILRFNSKYSLRLYEYVSSIHYDSTQAYSRYIDLDTLKKMLDAANYTEYKEFNRNVLKPAVTEINNYSDKIVTLTPVKNNRIVVGFEITIATKNLEDRIVIGAETENYLYGVQRPVLTENN